MKNITTVNKVLTLILLLAIAIIFWRWSVGYNGGRYKMNPRRMGGDTSMMMNRYSTSTPTTDEELDASINSSLQSNSEIELKGIDSEF